MREIMKKILFLLPIILFACEIVKAPDDSSISQKRYAHKIHELTLKEITEQMNKASTKTPPKPTMKHSVVIAKAAKQPIAEKISESTPVLEDVIAPVVVVEKKVKQPITEKISEPAPTLKKSTPPIIIVEKEVTPTLKRVDEPLAIVEKTPPRTTEEVVKKTPKIEKPIVAKSNQKNFNFSQKFNLPEARKFYFSLIESCDNPEVSISFSEPNSMFYQKPYIALIYYSQGKISYNIYDPEQERLSEIHKEDFKQAQDLVLHRP
jgi:hypothetical protein